MRKKVLCLTLAMVLAITGIGFLGGGGTVQAAAEPWQDAYAAFLRGDDILRLYDYDTSDLRSHLHFYLYDMDNDGVPELILQSFRDDLGMMLVPVYTYTNNTLKDLGIIPAYDGLSIIENQNFPGIFSTRAYRSISHHYSSIINNQLDSIEIYSEDWFRGGADYGLTEIVYKRNDEWSKIIKDFPTSVLNSNEITEANIQQFIYGWRSAAESSPPSTGMTVSPTPSTVIVNGDAIAFEAYLIGGNNFFKLRDLAAAVNGSGKQFSVGYNEQTKAITLTSGQPYTSVGGELARGDGKAKTANPTKSQLYIDNRPVDLDAYNIAGNNFFKLRDIMEAFDIGVDYDERTKNITVDTSKPYTE